MRERSDSRSREEEQGAYRRYWGLAPEVWRPIGEGGRQESARIGPHTGKGPRGYRRSDDRIREDVSDLLERDPDIDAGDVVVAVVDGVVTLSGTVADRQMKRLLLVVVDEVPGVKDVESSVRLRQGRTEDDAAAR
jgi:osmotically-inducible protein OsmY